MSADLIVHVVLILPAYALGASVSLFAPRLFGVAFAPSHAAFLVLALPLVSVLLAGLLTELWFGTPGSLGLGSLNVVVPLFVAGLLSGAAVTVAPRFVQPREFHLLRPSATLTTWLALAYACSGLALALWRFWPAPRARLW